MSVVLGLGLPTVPYFPGSPLLWPHCPASRPRPSRDAKCPVFRPWTNSIEIVREMTVCRIVTCLPPSCNLVSWFSGKSLKFFAIRCYTSKLKCIKFDFGLGAVTDPAAEAYSAPADPVARFKGSTSKGMEGTEGMGGRGRKDSGRKRRVREG